jgi:hypothetical protein
MKFCLALFTTVLGLASAAPEWDDSNKCMPGTFDAACVAQSESFFHVKLFYNRKKGLTPEEFNKYWAYEHAEKAKDFHVRLGVMRYNQVRSSNHPPALPCFPLKQIMLHIFGAILG